MKFSINKDLILQPLQSVNGIIDKKFTQQILSHILVKLDGETISFSATDKEISITVSVPYPSNFKGIFTVSGQKLLDICRGFPDNTYLNISLNNDKNKLLLSSGKSRFTLATLPHEDYPNVDNFLSKSVSIILMQKYLQFLLNKTYFAMSAQDVRYYLNGLFVEFHKDKLLAISSDGHRLAFAELELEDTFIEKEDQNNRETNLPFTTSSAIIPRKAILELLRLLNDNDNQLKIYISDRQVQFKFSNIVFTSNIIDGKYPNYNRVIPYETDKEVIICRDILRQSLLRASILSHDKFRSARFELSLNKLKIIVHNPEQEEATEELDVVYSGANIEIGFNIAYILDALSALSTDNVMLLLSTPDSSCLLVNYVEQGERLCIDDGKPYECKYVIMPMRI